MALGPRAALIQVALGATCISFAAAMVRWIDLGPATIGLYRTGFAAVALAAAASLGVPGARRMHRGPLALRPIAWSVAAGAWFAADLLVFHKAIPLVGSGLATLLANTQVFWVAALGALLLGERLRWRFGACVLAALVGVSLLTWPGLRDRAIAPIGVVYGISTGFFYGCYYLCLRESRRHEGALGLVTNLALASGVCAAFLLLFAWLGGEPLAPPGLADLGKLALLGVLIHATGWLFISHGMPHVAAARGSLALLLQPVLASVWGIVLLGEPFGPLELVGAAVTLAAVYAATRERAA